MSQEILFIRGLHVRSAQSFLILDDEQTVNDLLKDYLLTLNFTGQIFQAYTIEEAKLILKENKPDYILSDWNLPDGKGVHLLQAVRSTQKFQNTPFLMITANDDIESMMASSKIGVSEYLVKPFNLKDFEQKLAEGWKYHLVKEEQFITDLQDEIKKLRNENRLLKDEIHKFRGL